MYTCGKCGKTQPEVNRFFTGKDGAGVICINCLPSEHKEVGSCCTACKKSLVFKLETETYSGENYGLMESCFGFGSKLEGDWVYAKLCEGCWEKALAAVGIKRTLG